MANEDVLGRANVEQTAEREAYYQKLRHYGADALWLVANDIEPWEPKSSSVPFLWRFSDLRDLAYQSASIVTPEEAGRRVVMLVNPKRKEYSAAVGWLYTGIQCVNPGESTSAHQHMASALRFVMEGRGAYTVVNGHKISLGARDFVLTPNGTWHDHGVDEDGLPCVWQDGLDIPLMNALEVNNYAVHPNVRQSIDFPIDDSPLTYSAPGLLPQLDKWGKPYSPLLRYSWDSTYQGLLNMAKVSDGSPYDGIIMKYVNPITGGHPMNTMGASIQLLRAKEHTKAHQHTGSFVYQVAKGRGYSVINGIKLEWQEKDIFCLPSWAVHEHVNLSETDDAVLFSFNDLPVMESLNVYMEKAYTDNNGHQEIITTFETGKNI